MKVAIIGTAGRDKSIPMTLQTWFWMCQYMHGMVNHISPKELHLVSGGAAWADHLAVALFLDKQASKLTLHLPAPLNKDGYFEGAYGTSGGAANYYHLKFSQVLGADTRHEILDACDMEGCDGTVQPVAQGYGALFARNKLVAQSLDPASDHMVAFTFGEGNEPADGGTKNTWDQFHGAKIHVTIPRFS